MSALVACRVSEQGINADQIEEIKISMQDKGLQVSGDHVYPKENRQGIQGIVDILNRASPTAKKA